jgi:DNA-binding NarL/FixJ family response regulator
MTGCLTNFHYLIADTVKLQEYYSEIYDRIIMKGSTDRDRKKLLLVDDDPNLVLLVRDYLEFRGYEVISASNGREALETLDNNIPDMIICDVMMPEVDGYSFVADLRKRQDIGWIPVLFLSAKGQSQDRIKGLNLGADVYMVKPFEPEELVAQVESSLSQSGRIRQYADTGAPSETLIQVNPSVELTPTEVKVVQLVAKGLANKDIALQMKLSQRTVESHVSNMLGKTGLNNRAGRSKAVWLNSW